jgi:hypothetical protein
MSGIFHKLSEKIKQHKLWEATKPLQSLFMETDKPKPDIMENSEYSVQSNASDEKSVQPPSVSPSKLTTTDVLIALLNGLGVGLLLGLLVGLSISPVVSGVIGTLSSLLVIMLGMNEQFISKLKSLRIAFFGIFTVVGILSGLYIRDNGVLSPKVGALVQEFDSAGYSKNQALYYAALEMFKYVPVGWFGTSAADTLALSKAPSGTKSFLFSSELSQSECLNLEDVNPNFNRIQAFNTFKSAGGLWEEWAAALYAKEEITNQAYTAALIILRDAFCDITTTDKIEVTAPAAVYDHLQNLEKIQSILNNTGEPWSGLVADVSETLPENQQIIFYQTILTQIKDENN